MKKYSKWVILFIIINLMSSCGGLSANHFINMWKRLNCCVLASNSVMQLSPGITKGIVPVGVSFTIRAFVQAVQRIMVPSNK